MAATIRRPRCIMYRPKSESGNALVFFALMLVILVGLVGLSVDVGNLARTRTALQSAADAAALAGAGRMPASHSQIVDEATAYALANYPGAEVTVHRPPITGPHTGDQNAVEVVVSVTLQKYFIGILYGGQWKTSARAIGFATQGSSGPPCGLYVLDSTSSGALSGTGSAGVTVNGGCVQVNSSASGAIKLSGSAKVTSIGSPPSYPAAVNVNGTCSAPEVDSITPPCSTPKPVIPDPLAGISTPSDPGVPPAGQAGCSAPPVTCAFSNSTNRTIGPGVYSKITNSNTAVITLTPGTYFITSEMKNSNTGRFVGNGVLLYFTCAKTTAPYWQPCSSAGQSGGSLSLTGGGGFNLTAPASGMLIFYDRNNTSDLSLTGSSGATATGTIYAAKATTTLTGPSGAVVGGLDSLVVTNKLSLTGSSVVNINYDPTKQVQLPGSGPSRVSLAE